MLDISQVHRYWRLDRIVDLGTRCPRPEHRFGGMSVIYITPFDGIISTIDVHYKRL